MELLFLYKYNVEIRVCARGTLVALVGMIAWPSSVSMQGSRLDASVPALIAVLVDKKGRLERCSSLQGGARFTVNVANILKL